MKNKKRKFPHGLVKAVSLKTGVSMTTVSVVLSKGQSSPKAPIVMKAAAEYLKEYREEEMEAREALERQLSI